LIGDEPRLAYNREMLSSVLVRETAPEAIELKPMSWWRDSPSQAQGAASLEISADVQRPASTR
jgi:nitrite reductase (NADH) large subunit